MKVCVLLGNTRQKSNTEAVVKIFVEELIRKGFQVKSVPLREKTVQSCIGCDTCHDIMDSFGCALADDMQEIAEEILSSDLLVFSSPIYTWFATAPLKAVMDRLFAFSKWPENADSFNLMKKQHFALITTSGDECAQNCDLLDEGIRRLANYAHRPYIGYFAAQDKDGINRAEVVDGIRAFAEKCAGSLRPA